MKALLEVNELSRHFGGLKAVDGVSFTVAKGSIHALIGPNGAGKTTVLNMLTGLLGCSGGTIRLDGAQVQNQPAFRLARAGIARTFQNGRLFARLSVRENVLCGGHHLLPSGIWPALWRPKALRATEAELGRKVDALLDRLGLADDAARPVSALPYGRQRLVEIARALACNPSLVLLDEPAAGLNSREADDLVAILMELRTAGTTIVVIEHNMGLVMKVADRIAVLNFGRLIADGAPVEVRADPAVLEAYLGGER